MAWQKLSLHGADQQFRELFPKLPRRARFLVDESLGPGTALLIRQLRWNVRDIWQLRLSGRADPDVFARARKENRILLTHDYGFWGDRAYPPRNHPGVVILPGGSGNEEALLKALGGVLSVVGTAADLWRGTKLVFSSQGELTVKRHGESGATIRRFWFSGGELYKWTDDQAA